MFKIYCTTACSNWLFTLKRKPTSFAVILSAVALPVVLKAKFNLELILHITILVFLTPDSCFKSAICIQNSLESARLKEGKIEDFALVGGSLPVFKPWRTRYPSPVVSHCLIDMRGRVVMGRWKGERRLVDPVFKMADASMADFILTRNIENRPFHRACINRKLPCPHISCRGEAGKVFFEEKGLNILLAFPPSHHPLLHFSPPVDSRFLHRARDDWGRVSKIPKFGVNQAGFYWDTAI